MQRFFISATGTDAGKTLLTVALLRQLRAAGKIVTAVKPVASGVQADDANGDAAQIARALGLDISPMQAVETLSAYSFAQAAAPNLAAQADGVVMEWARIMQHCQAPATADVQLIEGAGGLFSPLTDTQSNAALAKALDVPVILLGGTYLGSISHIAATLLAAQAEGVHIHALVLNQSTGQSALSPQQVAHMLQQQGLPLPPLQLLPWLKEGESVPPLLESFGITIEPTLS